LTRFEYNNTVRDLLGDASHPADALPPDTGTRFADADTMSTTDLLVYGYHLLAHQYALDFTKDDDAVIALTGCDPVAVTEDTCKVTFIVKFVGKVFRRPVNAGDVADFLAVFASGKQLGGDFASGVRAVVEVALQSPEFLYRVELGDPAKGTDPPRPSAYEMASRLSYLLWGSPPDATLLDAAAREELQTKGQIAAQARRLLGDPRAHDVVLQFYLQFLGVGDSGLVGHEFDKTRDLPADLGKLYTDETKHFLEDVTWQAPGDFHTLLTSHFTWVNEPLAKVYGLPGVTGDAFQRVAVNASQRGGVLTQGSFLSITSPEPTRTDPLVRGTWVLDEMLCTPSPPEPADVLLGRAFEHYDGSGLWRDTENGSPIDATGEIFKTDAKGKFNGALELSERLSQSHDVQNCFVGKWMAFAYGRQENPDDACTRQLLQDEFAKSKGNVIELIVALTQTDAFLYRSDKE